MAAPVKRKQVAIHDKLQVLRRLDDGENYYDIATELGICESTVRKWKVNRKEIEKWCSSKSKDESRLGKQCKMIKAGNEKLDEAVFMWYKQRREQGLPITGPMIQNKALNFNEKSGGKKLFVASSGWLKLWKRRYAIQQLPVSGESSEDSEVVKTFKDELDKIIKSEELTTHQIFNCAETGLYYRMIQAKAPASKAEDKVVGCKKSKDRLTIFVCSNASGTLKIPLTVIEESPKPKELENVNCSNFPVYYKHRKNSYTHTGLFQEWFDDTLVPRVCHFLKEKNLPLKACLIIDTGITYSLEEALQQNDIKTKFLPQNVTSLLQPMDQGVLEKLKKRYRCMLLASIIKAEESGPGVVKYLKSIAKKDIIFWIAKAWNEVTTTSIQQSWNKLWPASPSNSETDQILEAEYNDLIEKVTLRIQFLKVYSDYTAADVKRWLESDCVPDCLSEDEIISLVFREDQETDTAEEEASHIVKDEMYASEAKYTLDCPDVDPEAVKADRPLFCEVMLQGSPNDTCAAESALRYGKQNQKKKNSVPSSSQDDLDAEPLAKRIKKEVEDTAETENVLFLKTEVEDSPSDSNADDDSFSVKDEPDSAQTIEDTFLCQALNFELRRGGEGSNETNCSAEKIPFSPPVSPGLQVPPRTMPIEFFNMLFNDEFYNLIVKHTNENAESISLSGHFTKYTKLVSWKDVTIKEFKIFLGLLLHMGTIRVSRISDYWKKETLLDFHCFSSFMSKDRFMSILNALSFGESADKAKADDPQTDRISNFVDFFNSTMEKMYYPQKQLAIDEFSILRQKRFQNTWRSESKLFALAEQRGLFLRICFKTRAEKDHRAAQDYQADVVKILLRGLLNAGHSVFINNLRSIDLSSWLLANRTYSTGIVKPLQKDPNTVIYQKRSEQEKIQQFIKDGVGILKWKKTNETVAISSELDGEMIRSKSISDKANYLKPRAVNDFEKFMSVLDAVDQKLVDHSFEHNCLLGYKKLGIQILQIMTYNSFVLCTSHKDCWKKTFYDYRLSVIDSLFNASVPSTLSFDTQMKLDDHFPAPVPASCKLKRLYRKCRMCSTTQRWRTTSVICPGCPGQPGLCLRPCFQQFHERDSE